MFKVKKLIYIGGELILVILLFDEVIGVLRVCDSFMMCIW